MAHGFDYSLSGDKLPLNRPFIEIFSNIMDAETSDNPNALNNVTWTAEILGTMTLESKSGEVVDNLKELDLRIQRLVQQHSEVEIIEMSTPDDDKIEIIRENSRFITSVVTRVISRHILKIVCFSYINGPMAGCGVTNKAGLAFRTSDVYDTAYRFVVSELLAYGLYDVIDALESGEDIVPANTGLPKRRFGSVRRR